METTHGPDWRVKSFYRRVCSTTVIGALYSILEGADTRIATSERISTLARIIEAGSCPRMFKFIDETVADGLGEVKLSHWVAVELYRRADGQRSINECYDEAQLIPLGDAEDLLLGGRWGQPRDVPWT